MVSFRKLFPVLAVLGLLLTVSTASAQLTCDTRALQPGRLLRSEGLTEIASPVVITCTSAASPANPGNVLSTTGAPAGFSGNFRLTTSQNITSTKVKADASDIYVRLRVFENVGVANDPSSTNAVVSGSPLATETGTLSSDNTVDWTGVKLPYTSAATNLTIVIDNIRVNASGVTSAFTPVTATVQAVSFGDVNSPFSVNKDLNVGVIQSSIAGGKPTVTVFPLTQCAGQTSTVALGTGSAEVKVAENFANAFRSVGTILGGELTTYETGISGDFKQHGTFIVLRFKSIPSGITVYAGKSDIATGATTFPTTPNVVQTGSPSDDFTAVTLDATGNGSVTYEVKNESPTALDTYYIPVAFKTSSTTQANLGTGQIGVTLGPVDANTTAIADKSLAVRFNDATSYVDLITVNACSTTLLFPYVTSAGGWDTGIAIANTTQDVKLANSTKFLFSGGTKAASSQSGTCTLYYFGTPSTDAATTAVSVPAGTTYLMTLSGGSVNTPNAFNVAGVAGFTGYMIAQCNFQNAHGFAFLNGTASSGSAGVGYTALVMNGGTRITAASESFNQ